MKKKLLASEIKLGDILYWGHSPCYLVLKIENNTFGLSANKIYFYDLFNKHRNYFFAHDDTELEKIDYK